LKNARMIEAVRGGFEDIALEDERIIETECRLPVRAPRSVVEVAIQNAGQMRAAIQVIRRRYGETSDSPLPLALSIITGDNNLMYHLLITVGLFGLVASFHGLVLAAGRSTYEMGKSRSLPAFLGKISSRFQTPANALIANMIIGIIALLTGKTAEIIIISVFGALTLYIISMISILVLRKTEPHLARPFKVPVYPLFPILALLIAFISFIAMLIYNLKLGLIYLGIVLGIFLLYKIFKKAE